MIRVAYIILIISTSFNLRNSISMEISSKGVLVQNGKILIHVKVKNNGSNSVLIIPNQSGSEDNLNSYWNLTVSNGNKVLILNKLINPRIFKRREYIKMHPDEEIKFDLSVNLFNLIDEKTRKPPDTLLESYKIQLMYRNSFYSKKNGVSFLKSNELEVRTK